MKRVKCPYCDKAIKLQNMQKGYEYHCPTCDSLVYRPGESQSIITSLSLSTLVVFLFALFSPLLSVYIIDDNRVSIWESIIFLLKTDVFSGFILLFSIVIIPFFMVILTLCIIHYEKLRIDKQIVKTMIKAYLSIKEWNMIEVYFVGLLISLVKLYELSDVTLLAGFFINAFYVILLYLSLTLFNPYDVIHIHKRKKLDKNSIKKSLFFLLLAFIFIPPSNILPIMPTYQYSVEYPNTILGGIYSFYRQGDYFVAGVVFFASVCIPVLKIVGVGMMILMVKFNIFSSYKKFATKYYIITDSWGKYSMLDVYVVVLAASFIQYDDLVRIGIGEAIIPFSLVVFFTMIASKSFDTRLMWKENNG